MSILIKLSRGLMSLVTVLIHLFNVLQGGVTEEQMLRVMGANTTLTPKEAVRLLEVCIVCTVCFHGFNDISFWSYRSYFR